MQRATVDRWLEAYVAAWKSYDPGEIEALFAAKVRYRYHPYDDPIEGRDAVVASWLGDNGSPDASGRDQPGTYNASYRAVAVDGPVAVATGSTRYREEPSGPDHADLRQLFRDPLRSGRPLRGPCRVVHRAARNQPLIRTRRGCAPPSM